MAYGAGDKPSAAPQKTGSRGDGADTKTVKVKAHKRTIRVGKTRPIANPVQGGLVRPQPAAPSPAVKEQHAALAQEQPKAARAQQRLEVSRVPRDIPSSTPGAAVLAREHHAAIAQTRPDRRAGRHADLAAALAAVRAQTRTEGAPPAPEKQKAHAGVLGLADSLLSGELTKGAVGAAAKAS